MRVWFLFFVLLSGCGGGGGASEVESEISPVPVLSPIEEPPVQPNELKIKSIIMQPENYSANDTLKPFVSVQDYITFRGKTVCKWHIDNVEVSNACEYTLKDNEHLKPISLTVFVTEKG